MADITTAQVWEAIKKQNFAVLGMVNTRNEPRTVGIVYQVHNRKMYIASKKETWKVRHIEQNPHVSLTTLIHKSIPLMPWIKIPAATITFQGMARALEPAVVSEKIIQSLFRGLEMTPESSSPFSILEVTPIGSFLTYGVGVSLLTMRDTEKARGRVAVD
jgi:hypothetical protein